MTRPVRFHDGLVWRSGRPSLVLSATVQYFRLAPAEWADRLEKVKGAGFDTAEVYVPWNYHETSPGRFDFEHGARDLLGFLRLAKERGLDVMLRPGPFICAEYDGGGLPARLSLLPEGALREAREPYLDEALAYWRSVLSAVVPLQADRGGPITMVQVENELDFFPCKDPTAMVQVLAEEARRAGIAVPLFTCAGNRIGPSGGDAPDVLPGINVKPPASGAWEDRYRDLGDELRSRGVPLMVIETYRDPAVLRRLLAVGAKVLGPYMVTGGVHLGPMAAANNWAPVPAFMASDYDFRSPIAADGYLRPGYEALRELFATVSVFADLFARALPVPYPAEVPEGVIVRALGVGSCRIVAFTLDREEGTTVVLPWPGGKAVVDVEPHGSQFLFEAAPLGDGTVLWSTLEPVASDVSTRTLDLVGRPGQQGSVSLGDGVVQDLEVPKGGTTSTVRLGQWTFRLRERSAPPREELPPNPLRNLPCPDPKPARAERLAYVATTVLSPDWESRSPFPRTPSLEELPGPGTGEVWYAFAVPEAACAMAFAAADVVMLYADGRFTGASLTGGRVTAWPLPPGTREVWVRVASWGHSAFWDDQLPSLRMGSRRGITGPVHFLAALPAGERIADQSPALVPADPSAAEDGPEALPAKVVVASQHEPPALGAIVQPLVMPDAAGVLLRLRVAGCAAGTRVHLRLHLRDIMAVVRLDGQVVGRELAGPSLAPHMTGGALPAGEFVIPWGLLEAGRMHSLEIDLRALAPGASYGPPEWLQFAP